MQDTDYGIPEIYEKEAKGNLGGIYRDIQTILKVPIVNFMFRTLALYETFLGTAWTQVRSNMLTVDMENAAENLRYPDISVKAPDINWGAIYDLQTIEQIKSVIITFNYVNPKLLLIASAWAESLGNRPIQGTQRCDGYIAPGVFQGLEDIRLVDICRTAPDVQSLLLDITKKHRAYDAASDYRALAHYPMFLARSWESLKQYVGSDEYHLLGADLKQRSIELVHERMPFPVTINTDYLSQIYNPGDIAGIMGIIAMFQNILPDLIIEGEFFRRMGGPSAIFDK
ncbi:Halocarboxylic acid dehydrogenase DehI [Lentibacillus halodurans]|uniref:Halocarboxylic acid dehydrogenase DehI n=1 Tax=Lentibacillus halodurans TaxID=237679 RepID=A0A1I0ZB04_9BACI|nr:halocarboxylic acid dehydrogenase DehI family protein [Lentibacillus halodurans]SFB21413.1 Halocarboxylic acid dehydrogenase DehI [Lentibacillus halodurans]